MLPIESRSRNVASLILCVLAAIGLVLLALPTRAADFEYSDGTFADVDWDLTIFYELENGGLTGAIQVGSGGNPGPYRHVTNTLLGDGGSYSGFLGFHRYVPALYSPATQGAITSIDFYEQAKLFSGGSQGQSSGPAIRQNGLVYIGEFYITPDEEWTPHTMSGLTAADFYVRDNPGQHPDFSESGAPIEVGFMRGNWGSSFYTIESGIDNWRMVIHSDGPTPTAESSWGRIKATFR